MSLPHGMFDELGQVAAKYNQRASQHAPGCCTVCRKALVGLFQALLDPDNWKPESAADAIQRLSAQVEALQHQQQRQTAPPAPMIHNEEEYDNAEIPASPSQFPPPFNADEE